MAGIEVRIDAVDVAHVPKDTYVSMRVGDYQKQSRSWVRGIGESPGVLGTTHITRSRPFLGSKADSEPGPGACPKFQVVQHRSIPDVS